MRHLLALTRELLSVRRVLGPMGDAMVTMVSGSCRVDFKRKGRL